MVKEGALVMALLISTLVLFSVLSIVAVFFAMMFAFFGVVLLMFFAPVLFVGIFLKALASNLEIKDVNDTEKNKINYIDSK